MDPACQLRPWIESLYQQNTILKSHMGFPTKLKYLTFGDPGRSRSLSDIFDAKYLANATR